MLGIGVNVAVDQAALPPGAATLGRAADALEAALAELLAALEVRLAEPADATLAALRARDALADAGRVGRRRRDVAAGIAQDGALRVRLDDGGETMLAGGRGPPARPMNGAARAGVSGATRPRRSPGA